MLNIIKEYKKELTYLALGLVIGAAATHFYHKYHE
jgi:hypothetical protein